MNKKDLADLRVVISRLDDMKEVNGKEHREIKEHLILLNGQTDKNTKFRHLSTGAYKIIGIILGGGAIVTLLVFLIPK